VSGPAPLWSLASGPGSWSYALFDATRRGLNRRLADALLRGLDAAGVRAPRALEAGSGPGRCATLMAQRRPGLRAVRLDHDAAALAAGGADAAPAVQGDLYRMPFDDRTFDIVFNSSTMEHLDDFAAALAEMARVTRPGGRIFVGVPYRYGVFLPFMLVPAGHPASAWMGRLYSRRALLEACRRPGLRVLGTRWYFGAGFVGVLLARDPA
jgi:SAM-dependent methyltransferase